MNYVLWLVSWYPNKTDQYAGDFIERQAHSVSAYTKLIIIFVTKDKNIQQEKIEVTETENLIVYKGYYNSSKSLIQKIVSAKKYLSLQKKIFKTIFNEHGKPLLVHVHIAMKAGLLALYLKKRHKIKYIVSEHWSGYFTTAGKNIYNSGVVFKNLNKKILRNADLLIPVTNNLGETINENFIKIPFIAVPNVVDTKLFYYKPQHQKIFRFIHVSSMDNNKNPIGIIAAAKLLLAEGFEFHISLIGAGNASIKSLSREVEINNNIYLKNEISYSEVAEEMQNSSAFILFSRIESMPCVILEALCCGIPVISSDVGGIKEVINANNGILICSDNIIELKEAMKKMILQYESYNRQAAAKEAERKFNYDAVGNQIFGIYQNIFAIKSE